MHMNFDRTIVAHFPEEEVTGITNVKYGLLPAEFACVRWVQAMFPHLLGRIPLLLAMPQLADDASSLPSS
jgi:hypothetical protein